MYALAVVVFVLVAALALVLLPLAAPLVLASWTAKLARPLFERLRRVFRGRQSAAAALTLALVLLTVAPFVLVTVTLIPAAHGLVDQLRAASGGRGALAALVSADATKPSGEVDVAELVRRYGASASKAASFVLTTSTGIVAGAFVYFCVVYALLVDGDRAYAWLESRAPVDRGVVRRLASAFHQTGRGLVIGTGGTAITQGLLATVVYWALGVPRAPLFGLLTAIAAVVPAVGTALVWVPVAAGLILTGSPVKGVVLLGLGTFVIGSVDNLLRPWLSKRANVGLATVTVIVAVFGGAGLFGLWGIILGPLVVRLAVEVLDLARERRIFARGHSVRERRTSAARRRPPTVPGRSPRRRAREGRRTRSARPPATPG